MNVTTINYITANARTRSLLLKVNARFSFINTLFAKRRQRFEMESLERKKETYINKKRNTNKAIRYNTREIHFE